MSEASVSVIVQMYDRTRKAEVSLSRSTTTRDLLEETKRNWSLPNVEYRVTNITKNKELLQKDQFTEENVSDKDVLQIEPILQAG
jgi:sulfur carrier protein ThiS